LIPKKYNSLNDWAYLFSYYITADYPKFSNCVERLLVHTRQEAMHRVLVKLVEFSRRFQVSDQN